MVCKYCNKEFSNEYKYCPHCAEPVVPNGKISFTELKKINREERVKHKYKAVTFIVAFLLFVVSFPLGLVLGWFFFPGTLGNDVFCDKADIFATVFWLTSIIGWIIVRAVYWQITKNSKLEKRIRKQIISDQFMEDQTSICPNCGSHNIKTYQEGYNYNKGFWLRMFDVKGGGYVAGMNSNRARCRCMNCGTDWSTNYDYRLIDK